MSTIITIKKPIDVTVARNFLRKRIAGSEWTPTCRARAAAVLTIYAEFILNSASPGAIIVSVLKEHNPPGIVLKSTVQVTSDREAHVMEMEGRLKRVTDESEVALQDQFVAVCAWIWTTGKVALHE